MGIESAKHSDLQGDKFARLVISDNGTGIPESHMDKVFEPFFTTKGVGDGTGLGLAMVYGSIINHGGLIEVESAEGEGTTFSIYLPLCAERRGVKEIEKNAIVQGQGETILLVDDEVEMRRTIGEVLRNMGYQVLEAADGEQAMECFMTNNPDLIVTDVVMPNMGDFELAQSIRQINDTVPVIFCTGYDNNALDHNYHLEGSETISKPFSFDILSQSIRGLLEA